MVPLPFQGDVNPMIQLASVLHAKGFSILVAHPQTNFPHPSDHPEFTFLPLKGSLTNSTVMDLIPELHPLRFKDLPVSNLRNLEALLPLVLRARKIGSSSGIIWKTTEFLELESLVELQQQFQIQFLPIGPLHKLSTASSTSFLTEDAGCIEWLDKQAHNSVIYVSFGSLAPVTEEEFTEMA
ncbi:UDP-glucose iridoid glucosyltransferase-like [Punica granatum]|uniref:UDP-glucose iridoid glucosyltransferase-like n=1 Tax=Punica granatum TaxID=22663 RepID=A0A6P8CYY0_PUNGR|nr:UDP-glucose iridoid glucosyltransferase-like [Punica granatum]